MVAKRIFIVGPSGCKRKEKTLTLAEELNYTAVSVSELLEKEISNKTSLGEKIAFAKSKFAYGKAKC